MSYPKDPYYEKPPVGGSYPQQMAPPPSGQYHPSAPPAYPGAPPPYSAVAPGAPSPYTFGPGALLQAQLYAPSAAPPPYTHYGQPVLNPHYPVQQGFSYSAPLVATAQFDPGARFDGIASHNIPPPPPGCAPNAAQLVAAQGGTVIASQRQSNWFTGNGGGISW